ncbi:surface carbohydrate biosynthesis protein [Mesorhizobium sp. 10J20-29]
MVSIYLPVTSQPRELDAKLLLALVARERGHKVWIGYKSAFQDRLSSLAQGVFIIHNARQDAERVRRIRHHGHRIFVLDEEALVRQTDEIFIKKHPKLAFDSVSKILCWGKDNSDLWERYGIDAEGGKAIVGNPRFDLLRPEIAGFFASEIDSIKARFGDYILLNTNFPTVNNLTREGGGVRISAWAMDKRGQDLSNRFVANKQATLNAMLALIPPLAAAISPMSLIIRPHPNEDHTPWVAMVREIPNAHVIFEGGVVPWLLAARALLHNNCTTAVEAAAAGIPTINFLPWASDYDNRLANSFGRACATTEEIIVALIEIGKNRGASLSQDELDLLQHYVVSTDGPLSCERIVELAEREYRTLEGIEAVRWGATQSLAQARLKLLWLKRFLKLYRSKRGRRRRAYLKKNYPSLRISSLDYEQLNYSEGKFDLLMRQFPPLDEAVLNDKIRRFSEVTGRFGSLKAELLSQHLFRIV